MSSSQQPRASPITPTSPTMPSPLPGERGHAKRASIGSHAQLPLPTATAPSVGATNVPPNSHTPSPSLTNNVGPSTSHASPSLHTMLPISPSKVTTPLTTGVSKSSIGLNSPTSISSQQGVFASMQGKAITTSQENLGGPTLSPVPTSGPVFTGTHTLPITASNIQLLNNQFTSSHHHSGSTSGTHAAGIQPSVGFFRPVRPGATPGKGPGSGGFSGLYGDRYAPAPYAVARLPPPPSLDEDLEGPSEDERTEEGKPEGRAKDRLSNSPMLNSSLSQHAHHHSNHSDEQIRAHEDGSSTQQRSSGETGLKPKVSKEPLLDGNPGHRASIGARTSIDASAKPKRSSVMSITTSQALNYRPRLTFESLRSGNTKRESREVQLTSEKDEYPLTPKRSWAQRKNRRRSGFSSRSASPPTSIRSVSVSSDIHARNNIDEDDEGTTESPTRFVPHPPNNDPYPKSKTPLKHPLDPSLIPISKLEELPYNTNRKRKRGLASTISAPLHLFHSQPKDGSVVKRYELHPSRNHFFFGGRSMTGGDSSWAFIMTVCLIFGLAGVWFGTTSVWWWREAGLTRIVPGESGQRIILPIIDRGGEQWLVVNSAARKAGKAVVIICIYAACIVISSMMYTAFSDPGILPRNLDPDPPYPSTSPSDGGIRAPIPRDLKVRSDTVRVKYCPTCKIYRPPRASHCKMCDNCVDACDHHCQWVNNCIGSRNYTMFFVLLFSATLTLMFIMVTAALQIYYATKWGGSVSFPQADGVLGTEGLSFRDVIKTTSGIGSAVVFCVGAVVIWPVSALLTYHLRLLLLNTTTIEQIRNQAHKSLVAGPAPPNPFSHGSWRKNFVAMLCRPQQLSWLDGSAIATEDKREINPGMLADHVNSLATTPVDLRSPEDGSSHGVMWAGIGLIPLKNNEKD